MVPFLLLRDNQNRQLQYCACAVSNKVQGLSLKDTIRLFPINRFRRVNTRNVKIKTGEREKNLIFQVYYRIVWNTIFTIWLHVFSAIQKDTPHFYWCLPPSQLLCKMILPQFLFTFRFLLQHCIGSQALLYRPTLYSFSLLARSVLRVRILVILDAMQRRWRQLPSNCWCALAPD